MTTSHQGAAVAEMVSAPRAPKKSSGPVAMFVAGADVVTLVELLASARAGVRRARRATTHMESPSGRGADRALHGAQVALDRALSIARGQP